MLARLPQITCRVSARRPCQNLSGARVLTQEQRAALPPRESPQFTGRVIAALHASDELMAFSGRTVIGAELGAYLDVTDVDGSRPRSRRHVLGGPPEPHPSLRPEAS